MMPGQLQETLNKGLASFVSIKDPFSNIKNITDYPSTILVSKSIDGEQI